MKKFLSLLFVIAMLFSGVSAMAQSTVTDSYTLNASYVTLNPYNNRIALCKGGSYTYTMIDVDGNELTSAPYLCMDELHEFFEVATEKGLNNRGLIDANGAEVIPMQYGDIDYLDSRWQIGVVLEPATADNYDYKTLFSAETSFYLVSAYDVYYCGKMIGSLNRSDYSYANPFGAYLYIKDRAGNYSFYDSEFNKSDCQSASGYSEYGDKNWHLGSNQQAFTPGCTLTPDEVDQDISCINNQFFDLQGNLLFNAPNSYDSVYEFKGDYASVTRDGKYGLINKNGEEVVPCLYEIIYCDQAYMCGGYQAVVKDGKVGYVDAQGNETTEFKYSESSAATSGYSLFTTINGLDGRIIVVSAAVGELPNTYDRTSYPQDEACPLLAVSDGDKAGVIDLEGNAVIPLDGTYDSIYDLQFSNDGTVVIGEIDYDNYAVYKIEQTAPESTPKAAAQPTQPTDNTPTDDQPAGETWTCADCNTQNSGNFCTNCGAKRPEQPETIVCAGCGYQPEGDIPNFCPNCGMQF